MLCHLLRSPVLLLYLIVLLAIFKVFLDLLDLSCVILLVFKVVDPCGGRSVNIFTWTGSLHPKETAEVVPVGEVAGEVYS